jgi:hypothetical protein
MSIHSGVRSDQSRSPRQSFAEQGLVLGATIQPHSVSMISLPENVTPERKAELQTAVDDWVAAN